MKLKKWKLKTVLTLAVCVCAVGSTATLPVIAAGYRGDIDGDGVVSIADVVFLNKYLAGNFKVTDMDRLDYDNDCVISCADADALLRLITHLD